MTTQERLIETEAEWAISAARAHPGTTQTGGFQDYSVRWGLRPQADFIRLVDGLFLTRLPRRTKGRKNSMSAGGIVER